MSLEYPMVGEESESFIVPLFCDTLIQYSNVSAILSRAFIYQSGPDRSLKN